MTTTIETLIEVGYAEYLLDTAPCTGWPAVLRDLARAIAAKQPEADRALDAYLARDTPGNRQHWVETRDALAEYKARFAREYAAWSDQRAEERCPCGTYALGGLCAACAESLRAVATRAA